MRQVLNSGVLGGGRVSFRKGADLTEVGGQGVLFADLEVLALRVRRNG
jgi:hypothetical protein